VSERFDRVVIDRVADSVETQPHFPSALPPGLQPPWRHFFAPLLVY